MLRLTLRLPQSGRALRSTLTTLLSSLPGSLDPTIQTRWELDELEIIVCDTSGLESSTLIDLWQTLKQQTSSCVITLSLSLDGSHDAD